MKTQYPCTGLKKIGIVKWFDKKKGYGFITSEKQDYFVHYTGIIGGPGPSFQTLKDKQKVEFDFVATEKGLMAVNVHPSI